MPHNDHVTKISYGEMYNRLGLSFDDATRDRVLRGEITLTTAQGTFVVDPVTIPGAQRSSVMAADGQRNLDDEAFADYAISLMADTPRGRKLRRADAVDRGIDRYLRGRHGITSTEPVRATIDDHEDERREAALEKGIDSFLANRKPEPRSSAQTRHDEAVAKGVDAFLRHRPSTTPSERDDFSIGVPSRE